VLRRDLKPPLASDTVGSNRMKRSWRWRIPGRIEGTLRPMPKGFCRRAENESQCPLIVLIVDITNDLFQNIFKGDDP